MAIDITFFENMNKIQLTFISGSHELNKVIPTQRKNIVAALKRLGIISFEDMGDAIRINAKNFLNMQDFLSLFIGLEEIEGHNSLLPNTYYFGKTFPLRFRRQSSYILERIFLIEREEIEANAGALQRLKNQQESLQVSAKELIEEAITQASSHKFNLRCF